VAWPTPPPAPSDHAQPALLASALEQTRASRLGRPRRARWTTSEHADRRRSDFRFAPGSGRQRSLIPAPLVLVHSRRLGMTRETATVWREAIGSRRSAARLRQGLSLSAPASFDLGTPHNRGSPARARARLRPPCRVTRRVRPRGRGRPPRGGAYAPRGDWRVRAAQRWPALRLFDRGPVQAFSLMACSQYRTATQQAVSLPGPNWGR
jgi:hypothetical protein